MTGTLAYGKVSNGPVGVNTKVPEATANTVFVYTRAGLNKAPVAHLPGHRKPSIAVRCSPILYKLRDKNQKFPTRHMLVDRLENGKLTVTNDESSAQLPDSLAVPPPLSISSNQDSTTKENKQHGDENNDKNSISNNDTSSNGNINNNNSDNKESNDNNDDNKNKSDPSAVFALPYRTIYAVATQDSVLLYDTQQTTPLCVVSNLHFATFTDLSWSTDGLTLLMTSSDGFCSVLAFEKEELGEVYTGRSAAEMNDEHIAGLNGGGGSSSNGINLAGISKIPEPTTSVGEPPALRVQEEQGAHVRSGGKRATMETTMARNPEGTEDASNGDGGTMKKRRIAPTFVSGL